MTTPNNSVRREGAGRGSLPCDVVREPVGSYPWNSGHAPEAAPSGRSSSRPAATMPKDYPDHHDADLVIRFYEMRREAVTRDARKAMAAWMPQSWEDVVALGKPDHPNNAAFRQLSGYWEMVYGMARHGIAHGEFLMENSGEGMFFYSRFEPYLAQMREHMSPRIFTNCEWVSKNTEMGKAQLAMFVARWAKMKAAK